MVRVNWWKSLIGSCNDLSRQQRRALASRRRRLSEAATDALIQRLEDRTLLAAPNPLDLSSLDGRTGFRLDGALASDFSGYSVSGAGDVNGDGFDDLIVGAFGADTSSGSSYVLFGRSGGSTSAIELSGLDGTTGFRLDGAFAGDQSGFSVSGAGDVNGDGFKDVIVGAFAAGASSGSSYVLFGRSGGFASVIELSSLDGTTGFRLDGALANDGTRATRSAAPGTSTATASTI